MSSDCAALRCLMNNKSLNNLFVGQHLKSQALYLHFLNLLTHNLLTWFIPERFSATYRNILMTSPLTDRWSIKWTKTKLTSLVALSLWLSYIIWIRKTCKKVITTFLKSLILKKRSESNIRPSSLKHRYIGRKNKLNLLCVSDLWSDWSRLPAAGSCRCICGHLQGGGLNST